MSDTNGLPEGWSITPLSSALLSQVTRNPKVEEGDFFEYVDIDALDNKKQVISTPKRIAKGEAPSRARMGIHKGDVIFSLVRPYLKNIAVVPESLNGQVASTAYCVLSPAAGIEGHFLFYQVLQDSFIHSIPTYGNSPPSARDDEFLAMQIRVAPLNEQRRIVAKIEELFSDLDTGVAALERIRANLKRYRAAVLKAAVEGNLTKAWRAKQVDAASRRVEHVGRIGRVERKRVGTASAASGKTTRQEQATRQDAASTLEPASKLLERILVERRQKWEEDQLAKFAAANKTPPKGWREKYVEPAAPETSGLPELPRGWCWASFETLMSEALRNGHSAKASGDGTGIRTLTLTAVTLGDFSEKNTKLTIAKPDAIEDLWLQPGDFLIERSNTPELVGTARLYRGPAQFAIFPDLLIRVRIVPSLVKGFVEVVLQSNFTRQYFRWRAKGLAGSMPKIDQGTILGLPVPVPPLAEQTVIAQEVARLLSIIEGTEAQVDANLKRAARLRQSILKRAFEGRLVPQDPTDEPAGKLLERIRQERTAGNGGVASRTRRGRASRQQAEGETHGAAS